MQKKNTPCWVSFDAIILAQDTEQAVQITRLNLRAGTTDGSNRFTVQILYESIHKNNSINDEFINPKILAFAGSNVDLIQPVEGKL